MVRGDPPVVSERMSYQVWLATPGDHSGDGEVRNHWNGNDLQGFPTFCVVRGGPPVVSERMSYQVWLATPGSYQVWLATPGDHSGDREVRNHWNSNDLQGFPTFCVVRGDPPVVSERMSYQVWLAIVRRTTPAIEKWKS